MKKRILSLALALALCLGLTIPALAADYTEVVPCKYDGVGSFSEGLALVRLNGKWGYIDKTGREVVPCKYDDAEDFSEGLAEVELNGKWGYIDTTGREVVPCKYDGASSFSEGLAPVWLNGKCGYIDTTGREVVPCKYDSVRYFSEGLVWVKLNGKWDAISVSGVSAPQPAAHPSTQNVLVDGSPVEFPCYALKDANGNDTNYIKLRDVAQILNGTPAQFEVTWDGAVNIVTGQPYTANGSEMNTPFSGSRPYTVPTSETRVNGQTASLDAIILTDDAGNGYTYYKLRDLGAALGFTVDWSADKGIFIETT